MKCQRMAKSCEKAVSSPIQEVVGGCLVSAVGDGRSLPLQGRANFLVGSPSALQMRRRQDSLENGAASLASRMSAIQLFKDDQEAGLMGEQFRLLSTREFALNAEISDLLLAFQKKPVESSFDALMNEVDNRHRSILAIHAKLTGCTTCLGFSKRLDYHGSRPN